MFLKNNNYNRLFLEMKILLYFHRRVGDVVKNINTNNSTYRVFYKNNKFLFFIYTMIIV